MSEEQKLQQDGGANCAFDQSDKLDQGGWPVQQGQQTQGCELNQGGQQDQQLSCDSSQGPSVVHAHTHQHADGTVHSHYHVHKGGDVPHEHKPEQASAQESVIERDSACESHAGDAIPVHHHDAFAQVDSLLVAQGLSYAYPHCSQPVFRDLSVQAKAGSVLGILGNNGAGKSTLLDLLAGITRPAAGSIRVGNEPLSGMSRREIAQHIAYVAQQQMVPHLSVYDEVLLGRKPHIAWSITERDRKIVSRSIASLNLEAYANRYCDELSGGERQKVFIARAIAQEPEIMILDEPTSALDPKNQLEVLEAIRALTLEKRLATILVLHDVNLALRFCDRFLLVRDGVAVAQGGLNAVSSQALTDTYDIPFKVVNVEGTPLAIPGV